ncbi:MAG: hypothetical protein KC593_06920 [Myxococcales bacterium]|nr:hypothetical protein [Myxococcales bacterium]MCB9627209.1 hypothetical protein [Sandaracinaceae bacterium]
MAKKGKKLEAGSERIDPNEALRQVERPRANWRVIGMILLGFGVLWLLAFMAMPMMGYVGIAVVGVLTAAAIGFGLYIWQMTRKSSAIVDIMKGATDAEGRANALAALAAQSPEGKDAMNVLAQAQLLAQDDPQAAIAKLEGIDIEKAPAILRNDIRAQLALMYLLTNKPKNALDLARDIKPEAQPQAKQKALYAAVRAESFARNGRPEDARSALEGLNEADPELAEVRPLVLRAQIYTFFGLKKRGLAAEAMARLVQVEPNIVMAMATKGHPEMKQLAISTLQRAGVVPKQRVRMR